MRGILVQSLVSRGVPFDVALETANQVRDRIADRGTVETGDLTKLIQDLLLDRYELEDVERPFRDPPMVFVDSGKSQPFSKGMLAASLQGAGLDPSDAFDVAREFEMQLLREHRSAIDRVELRDLVRGTIERTHGSRAADRYTVWREAQQEGRPLFVLVGGSTGVGKTSIAVEVARRLEIARVIGTDSIRQIMRLMFSDELMPEIHSSTYDAHERLPAENSGLRDPVITGFREQAQKIAVGVQALLDRALEENTSMLIEGVNLLPGVVDLERYRDRAHVIFLIAATLDTDEYRARFVSRGSKQRERSPDRYLEHISEILTIQDYILAEADHCGLPIIDNVQFDAAVLSAVRTVLATLKKSLGTTVK